MQLTFAMIKSKAVRTWMHPNVIIAIIENDFIIERLELRRLRGSEIEQLYRDHLDKEYWPILSGSVEDPVVLMALRANNCIERWRSLMGPTDPRKATLGTLRYAARHEASIADNVVHGSDSATSAERELRMMFGDNWYHAQVALGGPQIEDWFGSRDADRTGR